MRRDELVAEARVKLNPDPEGVHRETADVLIELASSAELFHDGDDVGYARFDVNGHKENWPIRSKGFIGDGAWLLKQHPRRRAKLRGNTGGARRA